MHQWIIGRLDRFAREDAQRDVTSRESVEMALQAVNRQIENLKRLRVRDLISDEEFATERESLQNEKLRLTHRLAAEETSVDWIEPARMLVLFSNRAVSWFLAGNLEVKRLVLSVAGLNPTLSDRQLNVDAKKPFERSTKTTTIPLGWSIVKDVRTRWQAHDQELIQTVAALQRLKQLVEPSEARRAA